MARIDDLVTQVSDKALRQKLEAALVDMKRRQRFGLVFEDHIPEMTALLRFPVTPGCTVQRRSDNGTGQLFQVRSLTGKGKAIIELEESGETESTSVKDLMVVKRFGDPIFPALTSVGSVRRGALDRPHHAVINGENFHTLQLLIYLNEGQVDCIYIDPPYNTGARDWKYNNRYVDGNDGWRHSKWLSFMEKRLRHARRLLKADGVLIVTIDEHEVHHLGMLLEKTFPDGNIQMVSTLINPASVARAGAFGRNDEYIFFVSLGSASPQRVRLSREWVSAKGRTHTGNIRWDLLRRSGPSSARKDSPGCFYPIYVDPKGPTIVTVGDALPAGQSKPKAIKGCTPVLPIRQDGTEGRWQWTPKTIRQRMKQGRVRITGSKENGFVVSILKDGEFAKITRGEFKVSGTRADGSLILDNVETETVLAVPGSQWRLSSHDATQYGSRLLTELLPGRRFPFPKSLYAVEDALRFFVQDKPNALILDFFGGSGTTAHAVFRLNHEDGGRRQSITVTNNVVSVEEASTLQKQGLQPGDSEWEALGIFEHITRPRITAAVTGCTPEGNAIKGDYKFRDEFPMEEGFRENVEFLRIDYLDPDDVDLGNQFHSIHPLLWFAAGGIGTREAPKNGTSFFMPADSHYAILFDESAFRKLRRALESRPDVTHVWIVTDSEDAFAEMRSVLPGRISTSMLYRDYLRNFRINTRQNL
jgi:adenine-specific DNA-methyltransferase